MKFERIAVIVLDSVGIGELPDSAAYGDVGAHTLGHIAQAAPGMELPNMRKLGLANIAPIADWQGESQATGYYGRMTEVSAGKDTMTGHWELMGLRIDRPFRAFPNGFPPALIDAFERETGRHVIGNKPASGTAWPGTVHR